MADESFEFSEEQNNFIAKLAQYMKFAAILLIFLGIIIGVFCGFTIVKHPLRGFSYLLLTILSIVFGVWTNSVSYSFRQMVETSGKDINILMDAFKTLKQVYALQIIWVAIIIILLIAILILNTIFSYEAIIIFNAR